MHKRKNRRKIIVISAMVVAFGVAGGAGYMRSHHSAQAGSLAALSIEKGQTISLDACAVTLPAEFRIPAHDQGNANFFYSHENISIVGIVSGEPTITALSESYKDLQQVSLNGRPAQLYAADVRDTAVDGYLPSNHGLTPNQYHITYQLPYTTARNETRFCELLFSFALKDRKTASDQLIADFRNLVIGRIAPTFQAKQ